MNLNSFCVTPFLKHYIPITWIEHLCSVGLLIVVVFFLIVFLHVHREWAFLPSFAGDEEDMWLFSVMKNSDLGNLANFNRSFVYVPVSLWLKYTVVWFTLTLTLLVFKDFMILAYSTNAQLHLPIWSSVFIFFLISFVDLVLIKSVVSLNKFEWCAFFSQKGQQMTYLFFNYLICMGVSPACVCVAYLCLVPRRKLWNLVSEWQVVMSSHLGAENWTWDLSLSLQPQGFIC